MTRAETIEQATKAGMVVKACRDNRYIAIRQGKATNPNERMRMTADGMFLLADKGWYWQMVTMEQLAEYLEGIDV